MTYMRILFCTAILAGIAYGQGGDPSREREITLGRQLAESVRGRTTPTASAAFRDLVRRAADRLAPQFPGDWPFQIEAVREPIGGALHEPLALPGGLVFVSEDLMVAAQSEAEVAGMLAHAMAHVADEEWERSVRSSVVPADAEAPPIGMLPLRRNLEGRADLAAVRAMAAAGYNPAALASYLDRMQRDTGGSMQRIFAALPDREQRVAAIRGEIGTLPVRAYAADSAEFAHARLDIRREADARQAARPTLYGK